MRVLHSDQVQQIEPSGPLGGYGGAESGFFHDKPELRGQTSRLQIPGRVLHSMSRINSKELLAPALLCIQSPLLGALERNTPIGIGGIYCMHYAVFFYGSAPIIDPFRSGKPLIPYAKKDQRGALGLAFQTP